MNFVDCATTELNKPNRDCFDLMVFFGKIYCFLFFLCCAYYMLGLVGMSSHFLILSSVTRFSGGTWKGVSIVSGHFWALYLFSSVVSLTCIQERMNAGNSDPLSPFVSSRALPQIMRMERSRKRTNPSQDHPQRPRD